VGHDWTPTKFSEIQQFGFCSSCLESNRGGVQVGRLFTILDARVNAAQLIRSATGAYNGEELVVRFSAIDRRLNVSNFEQAVTW
jgi:hypothetical protein